MAKRKKRGYATGWSWLPRRRWTRLLTAAIVLPIFALAAVAGYYYGRLSLVVEARLAGERVRVIPRVYARPLTLRVGLTLSDTEVIQRLNDLELHSSASTPRPPASSPRRPAPCRSCRAAATSPARCCAPSGPPRRRRLRRHAASGPAGAHRAAVHRRAAGVAGGARSAAAQRAGDHVARAPPPRSAVGDPGARAAGRAGHRRPPLLPPPGHRSDPHPRCAGHQPARRSHLPGGRQHHHPAAGPQLLPHRGDGPGGADRSALDPPQAARAGHGHRARDPGDQGGGARAVSERGLPRPPRVVRAARRRRGGAHLLRQGPVEHQPRRGGAARRRDPVAGQSFAVCRPRPRPRAAQRRAAGDGRRRVHHQPRPPTAPATTRSRWPRGRWTSRRRTSSTSSASSSTRSSRRWPRAAVRSRSTPRSISTCSARRRTRSAPG